MKTDFELAKKAKQILEGVVVACEMYKVSETENNFVFKVNYNNDAIITILQSEVLPFPAKMGPKTMVGQKVKFTIVDINEEGIFGSMKEAREILQQPILDRLYAGEVLTGIVTYITPWGAYVTIDGVVSGMLKNYDFSDDGTEVWKAHPKFSKIKVKYKKTNKKGNILLYPEKKRTGTPKYDITQIKAGDTFWGKITDVNLPNAKVRVLIDNATYVECKYPNNAYSNSIKNGYNVAVVVTKVIQHGDKYKLIGKIVSKNTTGLLYGRKE